MKFEYKVERIPGHTNLEPLLNEFGENEWEIFDIYRYADMIQLTFKREKKKKSKKLLT